MVDNLYPVVAFVISALFLVLSFYATNHIKEEAQKKQLKRLFGFCALFCIVDTVWGVIATGYLTRDVGVYYTATSIFLIFSAVVIFQWFFYLLVYSKSRFTTSRIIVYIIPLVVECILAITNSITNWVYRIDGEQWTYIAAPGQRVIYCIHILYLLAIVHVAVRRIVFTNDRFTRNRFKAVIWCVIVLTLFCAAQDIFPKAPMMSLGCLFAALILMVRISVVEETKILEDSKEHYQNSAQEIYSAFEAMARIYVSIHLLDLKADKQHTVKSTSLIDSYTVQGVPASIQIVNVMRNIVHEDHRERMVEFVDFSTLKERLKDKEFIFQEFMGLDHGWCMAQFIKVEEDANGNPIRVIHSVQDINDIKTKEIEYEQAIKEALENQNSIYEEMLRAQSNGVIAISMSDEIINLNDAAAKLLGYPDTKHVPHMAKVIFDNVEFEDEETFLEGLNSFKERGKSFEYNFTIKRGSEKMHIAASVRRFKVKSGEYICIMSLSDITRSKLAEARLKVLSETDVLTRIDNRRSGEQKIISMIEEDIPGMFCIIDVNKFKGINDSYGHQIGDAVLQNVAECIRQSFRDTDVVMRLGGDEFAVYAKELINQGVGTKCMEGLFERINAIHIDGCDKLSTTISVGIAFYEGNNSCTYNRLYQQADSVMYMSKNKGGNCYTIFKKLRG